MAIVEALRRALVRRPKTWISGGGGGQKHELFKERKRNAKQLERYRIIYDQGGVVTEAVNSYPLFLLRNGYHLEGPDSEKKRIQNWLDAIDFDGILWDAVTDTLVFGDAFQEIVPNRDKTPAYIVPRLASNFSIRYDDHGKLAGYTQKEVIDGKEMSVSLRPDQIVHLQLWRASGSMYGHSLIHRAYDDIMRDTKTTEATASAIKRHGFRKYHIKVGKEGETISKDVLQSIDKEFQELNEKNEFVTNSDIELSDIDASGLEQVDTYTDISLMRLAASLGVPEEILGLRRGSTDATATKRIDTFYGKISAMQTHIARCYNTNIIDRLTVPGTMKIVFNDVNPEQEANKAKWVAQIMKASADPFAVLPADWIKEQFGIPDTTTSPKKPEAQPEHHKSGVILEAPHAELIWRGIQKAIVKTASLNKHLGEPLYLVSEGLCYGLVMLDGERILNQDEFEATSSHHLMADDASLKRKQKLFYYDIKLLSLFTEPRRCEVPEGARNFAKKIEFTTA